MLIWLLCGAAVFVIAVMGRIIVSSASSGRTAGSPSLLTSTLMQCPTQHVYNTEELNDHSYQNDQSHMLVAIRGEVFDFSSFAPHHFPGPSVIPTVSFLFPRMLSVIVYKLLTRNIRRRRSRSWAARI